MMSSTMNKSSYSMKLYISSETSGFNLIINSDILMSLIVMFCHCPECDGCVNSTYEPSKKRGFTLFFCIECSVCSWKNVFCSSHERDCDKAGRKSYYFNMRSLISFREMGLGYSSMVIFCNIMNMPPPMSKSSYESLESELHIAYM